MNAHMRQSALASMRNVRRYASIGTNRLREVKGMYTVDIMYIYALLLHKQVKQWP